MYDDGLMPKPNGKVIGTLLTDPADVQFVQSKAEADGRTVSNWLRQQIKLLRQLSETGAAKGSRKKEPRDL